MSAVAFEECSAESRLEAITQLGALLAATTGELLSLIAVADREQDWEIDGASGMASWLVAGMRCSATTARELVRAASQLAELPELHAALSDGRLSWEQARPAATFATPNTDPVLAAHLPGCTVAQIEVLARQHRPRRNEEEREAARVRRIRWRPDADLGGYRYSGFLPTERAERLNQILTRMAETAGPDAETGIWDPFEVRCADALQELAEVRAAIDPDPDSCLVVVHSDADIVDGTRPGNGFIGDVPIAAESVRRLLCDCKIEHSIDRPDGTTVGIGRADRNVPRWLRRKVANRDGCCRFPGCERQIRHRHHVRHWTRGGPTDADNLIGLCWFHHHLVHEGGWTIDGTPDNAVDFVSPAGRRLTSCPRPLRPEVHRRAQAAAGLKLVNGGDGTEPQRAGPAP